ncbi:hypothetical protein PVL29_010136 [Vitis rotundifolia]|nr:hypothetical protein PVL29_010136 [Vitis rotundifolia]
MAILIILQTLAPKYVNVQLISPLLLLYYPHQHQQPLNHLLSFSPQFVRLIRVEAVDDEFEFAAKAPPSFHRMENMVKDAEAKGFNPGLIVLLLVVGVLLVFLVGNFLLYMYAQKTLPRMKKKPVSKKKMKRERLKQGVSAPGE